MVSPVRPSRESITLSSRCAQKGHFTRWVLLVLGGYYKNQISEIRYRITAKPPTPTLATVRRSPRQFPRFPVAASASIRPATTLRGTAAALPQMNTPQTSPAIESLPPQPPAPAPLHTIS